MITLMMIARNHFFERTVPTIMITFMMITAFVGFQVYGTISAVYHMPTLLCLCSSQFLRLSFSLSRFSLARARVFALFLAFSLPHPLFLSSKSMEADKKTEIQWATSNQWKKLRTLHLYNQTEPLEWMSPIDKSISMDFGIPLIVILSFVCIKAFQFLVHYYPSQKS